MAPVCGKSAARAVSGQANAASPTPQPAYQQQQQAATNLPALEYIPDQGQAFYVGQAYGAASPYNLPTPAVPL